MSQPPDGKKDAPRKKGLGRGLAALLGDDDYLTGQQPPTDPAPGERVIELPIERIEANPFQPRRRFEPAALAALSDSIRQHGVIQPLVVRPAADGYQLIAGERRMRASQMAGLTTVPVVVRQASDQQALLLALLENLQREDLNPMEEARAYARLAQEFELTQEDIAGGVGKDRSTVANSLRLLKLPLPIQEDVSSGLITAGHARALLALPSEGVMRRARDEIVARGLSVRATESLVKSLQKPAPEPAEPSQEQVHLESLADGLRRRLGSRVEIKRRGRKGSITIRFTSDSELERLLKILG